MKLFELIVSLLFGITGHASAWASTIPGADHKGAVVLSSISQLLISNGGAARISYVGNCASGDIIPFPKIRYRSVAKGLNPVDALREMFKGSKGVDLRKEQGGLIVLKFGEFPEAILNTEIRILNFSPEDR